ncbi:MAG TPA: phosphate ABC transporter substrate-binding protein PstS [Gemmatimonadales bacterium]|nr:phosphate ABC transporter substrate-binding protein PstS [Gemmatimonadales bacterium]
MIGKLLTRTPALVGAALLSAAPLAAQTALTGAGATFPNPIYSKWFDAYNKKTGVQINYQSIGSGGGIKQYTEGTVDFGASDGPMTDEQLQAVGGHVIHIPTVMGADVMTWNLPSLGEKQLRFDGPTIADIFLGKITKWNDKRLTTLNPGVALPNEDIIVVHRSDGSGTTYIFTDYLSKVSPEWKDKVGKATSVNWPVGLGGKGNEGVTQQVKQTEGALGYVELIYAVANKLPYGLVQNAAGAFVNPSLESVSQAAASAKFAKNTDFRVSITNAPGQGAYPISSFTWLLIRPDMKDAAKAKAMKEFLEWMIGPEAQGMAPELQYAALPQEVTGLIKERLQTLKAGGKTIAGM